MGVLQAGCRTQSRVVLWDEGIMQESWVGSSWCDGHGKTGVLHVEVVQVYLGKGMGGAGEHSAIREGSMQTSTEGLLCTRGCLYH